MAEAESWPSRGPRVVSADGPHLSVSHSLSAGPVWKRLVVVTLLCDCHTSPELRSRLSRGSYPHTPLENLPVSPAIVCTPGDKIVVLPSVVLIAAYYAPAAQPRLYTPDTLLHSFIHHLAHLLFPSFSLSLYRFFFSFFRSCVHISSILLFFCSFMSCCVRLLFRQVVRSFVLSIVH